MSVVVGAVAGAVAVLIFLVGTSEAGPPCDSLVYQESQMDLFTLTFTLAAGFTHVDRC